MLKIRFARYGAKNRPFYRVVLAEASSPRDGRFIENLGTFNPLLPKDNKERVKFNVERILHWIAKGAQPTERIAQMLHVDEKINYHSKKFAKYDELRAKKEKAAQADKSSKSINADVNSKNNQPKQEAEANTSVDQKG